jgi:hypothetical protein
MGVEEQQFPQAARDETSLEVYSTPITSNLVGVHRGANRIISDLQLQANISPVV